ncbi:UNKNOWN [Stylonychia lemnae]|uniref:Uncharacterized protein n=1 Tax=Stylonychia lemnae TaxID=5949 RepID=A0A078AYR7_STYLE|nr:UNKNOWN [Stylonychia lemnae]|eukprot:CDW87309.1 UNKNOWN [Stylonychia lemnae]
MNNKSAIQQFISNLKDQGPMTPDMSSLNQKLVSKFQNQDDPSINDNSHVIPNGKQKMNSFRNNVLLQSEPKKKNIAKQKSNNNLAQTLQECKDNQSIVSSVNCSANQQSNQEIAHRKIVKLKKQLAQLGMNDNQSVNTNSSSMQTTNKHLQSSSQQSIITYRPDSIQSNLKGSINQYSESIQEVVVFPQSNQFFQRRLQNPNQSNDSQSEIINNHNNNNIKASNNQQQQTSSKSNPAKGNTAGKIKRDMSLDALDYRKQVFGVGSSENAKDNKERKIMHHQHKAALLIGTQDIYDDKNNFFHSEAPKKDPREDIQSRETAHFRLTFSQNQWEQLEAAQQNKKRSGSNPNKHVKNNIFNINNQEESEVNENTSNCSGNNKKQTFSLKNIKSQKSLTSNYLSQANQLQNSDSRQNSSRGENLPLINPKHLTLDQQQNFHPLDQLKSAVTKINNMIPSIVNEGKQFKKKAHFLKRIQKDSAVIGNLIIKDQVQQQTRNKYVSTLPQQMSSDFNQAPQQQLLAIIDQDRRPEMSAPNGHMRKVNSQLDFSSEQSKIVGNVIFAENVLKSYQSQHQLQPILEQGASSKHPSRLPSLEKKPYDTQQQLSTNQIQTFSMSGLKKKLRKLNMEQITGNILSEKLYASGAESQTTSSHNALLQSMEGSLQHSPRRTCNEEHTNILRLSSSSILSQQLGLKLKQAAAVSPKPNEKLVMRYFPKDFFSQQQIKPAKVKITLNPQYLPSQ